MKSPLHELNTPDTRIWEAVSINSSWNQGPGNCMYLLGFGIRGSGFWAYDYPCLDCTTHLSTGSSDLSSAFPDLSVPLYLLRSPLIHLSLAALFSDLILQYWVIFFINTCLPQQNVKLRMGTVSFCSLENPQCLARCLKYSQSSDD